MQDNDRVLDYLKTVGWAGNPGAVVDDYAVAEALGLPLKRVRDAYLNLKVDGLAEVRSSTDFDHPESLGASPP